MRREESSANPEPDENPGNGASGPGERAYDEESLVGDEAMGEEPDRQQDA
jgi:hypothetical protein